MSFFKKIFNKEAPQRQLTDVKQLKLNDIIVLTDSFGLPESLRAQQFQVTAVNTYEYENKNELEWALTGTNTNDEIFLSLDIDDKTYLKFSFKLDHDDVGEVFDLDQFSEIFDEPGQASLTTKHDSDTPSQWLSDEYRQQTFAKVGYFHRKDHRSENISVYEGKDAGEQFELYVLFDQDQSRGVDVEVWSDGDTDVFLTLYRPTSDIVDMYPGS